MEAGEEEEVEVRDGGGVTVALGALDFDGNGEVEGMEEVEGEWEEEWVWDWERVGAVDRETRKLTVGKRGVEVTDPVSGDVGVTGRGVRVGSSVVKGEGEGETLEVVNGRVGVGWKGYLWWGGR